MFKSLKTIATLVNYIGKSFIKLSPVKPFTAKQSPATGCTCANITTSLWLVVVYMIIYLFIYLFIFVSGKTKTRKNKQEKNQRPFYKLAYLINHDSLASTQEWRSWKEATGCIIQQRLIIC